MKLFTMAMLVAAASSNGAVAPAPEPAGPAPDPLIAFLVVVAYMVALAFAGWLGFRVGRR